jgi:hypothetical protein
MTALSLLKVHFFPNKFYYHFHNRKKEKRKEGRRREGRKERNLIEVDSGN